MKKVLLILLMFITTNVRATTIYKTATVNATDLMMRTTAGGSSVMKDVDNDTVYLDRPKIVEILGSQQVSGTTWYKIYFNRRNYK